MAFVSLLAMLLLPPMAQSFGGEANEFAFFRTWGTGSCEDQIQVFDKTLQLMLQQATWPMPKAHGSHAPSATRLAVHLRFLVLEELGTGTTPASVSASQQRVEHLNPCLLAVVGGPVLY